jgi:hypothetical protein
VVSTHKVLRAALAPLVSALAFSSLVLAAPSADAALKTVTQTTTSAPTMKPGQTAWVSMIWTAPTSNDLTDFKVTATPPAGYAVSYPADKAFTSLYGSSTLVKKTSDFTAFKLSVPYSATGTVSIPVTVSYLNKGTLESQATTLSVPLVAYAGVNLTQVTTSVTVPKATPTWTQLSFTGGAPMLSKFKVTVTGPAGLVVIYPGDAKSAGLNSGDSLQGGATDFTAVKLDATALAKGTYDLTVTETFERPTAVTNTGKVSLVVS